MTYETILPEKKNHATTVTLNRPKKLNALTLQVADELHDALVARRPVVGRGTAPRFQLSDRGELAVCLHRLLRAPSDLRPRTVC